MIHHGDNLEILRGMADASVDLIATDPPYFTQGNWQGDVGAFEDSWESREAFVASMKEVAKECRRVLKPEGALFWQCDDRVSHVLRLMMEEVFGVKEYVTTITWKRTVGGKVTRSWARVTDFILMFGNPCIVREAVAVSLSDEAIDENYRHQDDAGGLFAKKSLSTGSGAYRHSDLNAPDNQRRSTAAWRGITLKPGRHWSVPTNLPPWFDKPEGYDGWDTFEKLDELDRQGLIAWPKREGGLPRFKLYLSQSRGMCPSNLWTDIQLSPGAGERVGYPTQKPVKLYERIVLASSKPGDVVLDPFCGSGTTGVAAVRHGRKFIGIDKSAQAVRVAAERVDAERLPLI